MDIYSLPSLYSFADNQCGVQVCHPNFLQVVPGLLTTNCLGVQTFYLTVLEVGSSNQLALHVPFYRVAGL